MITMISKCDFCERFEQLHEITTVDIVFDTEEVENHLVTGEYIRKTSSRSALAELNFCPVCGRPLNPKESAYWRVERAKTPILSKLSKGAAQPEEVLKYVLSKGFTEEEAEEAASELVEGGFLYTLISNGECLLMLENIEKEN